MRHAQRSLVLCALVACSDFGDGTPSSPTNVPEAGTSSDAGDAGPSTITPADPVAFPAAVANLPGLLGYWRFNDATALKPLDASRQQAGNFIGTPKRDEDSLLGNDAPGHAIGIVAGSAVAIDAPKKRITDAFTIGALVNADGLPTGEQTIIGQAGSFRLGFKSAFPVAFVTREDGSEVPVQGFSSFRSDTTHLLTAVFDNKQIILAVDGARVGAVEWTGKARSNTFLICFGGMQTNATDTCTATRNFKGKLDEVFVANGAATEAQIENLAKLAGFR